METFIRKLIILIVIVLSFWIYGCAGYWWPVHRDMNEELESGKIKTIAILPLRNTNLDSSDTKEVNQYFMTAFKKIMKNYYLISPEESLEIIYRDSLSERCYSQLASDNSSYTISEEYIKIIGKSIKCDAIVMSEISDYTKHTYVDKSKIITSCGVSYRLYSTKDGKPIWGNYVESYVDTDINSGPSPLINVAKAGIDLLFKRTHI